MPRSNTVLAALCLLVALAVLGITYESRRSLQVVIALLKTHPAPPEHGLGSAPNDSPVTVRGGSVENLTLDTWTQPYPGAPWIWEDSDANNTQIAIEGIPNGGADGIYTPSNPISNNWTITLYFRKASDDSADKTIKSKNWLTVCTSVDTNSQDSNYQQCATPGTTLGSTTGVYLVAVSENPKQFDSVLSGSANTIDGYSLMEFDALTCGGTTSKRTRCNHLKEIDVAGTGATIAGTSSSFDTTYACPGGGCDLWIGPSVAAMPTK